MFKLSRKFWVTLSVLLLAALGLAACGGTTSTTQQPVDVQVTLTEFSIDSSVTDFKVGTPYHFVVTNEGTVEHEFEIMPPTSPSSDQEQENEDVLVKIEEDDLQPGDTATVDYTFQQAYASGELEMACHLPGHYEAGMHTPITVSQ
jgi:uncharacterized cupredoxin-like copper-binding protein